jgi:RNA polymerase sigma factor (TIGR02999 family)
MLESERMTTQATPKGFTADNLTGLLIEWRQGDKAALDKLTPIVYDELRRIAHRYVRRERDGHTLATTALVNEAYVRLAGFQQVTWENRSHFFAVSARVMRHILIDYARRGHYAKRGGGLQRVSFESAAAEASLMSPARAAELIALDEALDEFAKLDPRKSQVVELRYFGGLTLEETADVLKVSLMTVRRDWRAAKAWLYKAVNGES